jgi:hypothetical protein
MRCLADFILDSDLCLADGAEPLTFNALDSSVSLTLSNVTGAEERQSAVLAARMVFDAESLDDVRKPALEKLAEILNFLAYTTNRKFALRALKRVIDWTPGVVDRSAVIFVETPEFDQAEPALDVDFTDTVERLLAMQGNDAQRAAETAHRS